MRHSIQRVQIDPTGPFGDRVIPAAEARRVQIDDPFFESTDVYIRLEDLSEEALKDATDALTLAGVTSPDRRLVELVAGALAIEDLDRLVRLVTEK